MIILISTMYRYLCITSVLYIHCISTIESLMHIVSKYITIYMYCTCTCTVVMYCTCTNFPMMSTGLSSVSMATSSGISSPCSSFLSSDEHSFPVSLEEGIVFGANFASGCHGNHDVFCNTATKNPPVFCW